MPDIVYCDNKDCCFYDDNGERCDAYRLDIKHGVCMGTPRHGRNVSENDIDEQLRVENAKLRELARHLYACLSFCDREGEGRGCGFCPYQSESEDCEFELRLLERGIEVER